MVAVARFSPPRIAPPVGAFSHLAVHPAGRVAYLSGQIGADTTGRVPLSIAEQTRLCFANIEGLLAELGAGPDALVKLTTFIVAADDDTFASFAAERREVFSRWFPDGHFPSHSAAMVAALARPDLLVEIEGIAYLGP